jgi:chromosome segregation ATPase
MMESQQELNEAEDMIFSLRKEVERVNAELEAAIVEVGQLKQGMWQMKDAEIERWKDAYENMRDFAVKSGLDITCYGAESV